MIIRQHLLKPTGVGVPSGPVRDGLDLWVKSDRARLGVSGARLLDGVNQTFRVSSNLVPGFEDFWIGAFVRPDAFTTNNGIMRIAASGETDFIYYMIADRILANFGGTLYSFVPGEAWEVGQFVHVLTSFDRDGNATLYVDGQVAAVVDITAEAGKEVGLNGTQTHIGSAYTTWFLEGGICRVAYGQGFLPTEAEVQAMFNFGASLTFAELPEPLKTNINTNGNYWNGLEATSTFFDAAAQANDATEVNGPIGSTAGPRVAQLVDTSGNDHNGSLVGLDEITSWKSNNADQTYSFIKDDVVGGRFGRMVDFADIDAAHVEQGPGPAYLNDARGIQGNRANKSFITSAQGLPAVDGVTLTCWLQADAVPAATNAYVFCEYNTTDDQRKWSILIAHTSGYLWSYCSTVGTAPTASLVNSAINVCDGQPHHAALVYDHAGSGTAILYLDGNVIDSVPTDGPLFNAALASVDILSNNSGRSADAFADVIVWDPRVYDGVLTPAEIQSHLDDGGPTVTPTVSHWPFTEPPRSLPHVAGGLSIESKTNGNVALTDSLMKAMGGWNGWTFAAWVNCEAYTTEKRLLMGQFFGTGETKVLTRVLSDGKFGVFARPIEGDVSRQLAGNTALPPSHWAHVCGGVDYATGLIKVWIDGYPDGELSTSWTNPATNDSGGATQLFSNVFPSTNNLEGLADYVTFYPGLLSDTDVALLAKGLDPIGDTPEAVWPADDGPQGPQPQDGDIITTLTSSEGRNLDFYGISAAQRPIWRASEPKLNNRPTLAFDGLDDCLEHFAKALDGTQGTIQIAQLWETGATIDGAQISQGDTGTGWAGAAAAVPRVTMNADGHQAGTLPADVFKVTTITCNGSQYEINGVPGGTGTWWDAIAAAKTVIGAIAGASNSGFSQVLLPEMLVYRRVLTAEELTQNNQYLGGKYGG